MEFTNKEKHGKANEKSAVEEAQIESLFQKLKPANKSAPVTVKECNIERCEIQLEECGADIDEIFIKLYGQPGHSISTEEQWEITKNENAKCKRAERISEHTEEGETVEENGGTDTEMVLIDEDIIEQKSVLFEQAEVDWDDLLKDLESSENVEKPRKDSKESNSFFSCTIV